VFRVEAQQHATRLSVFKGRVEMTSVADTDERDIVEAGHAATLDGTKLEAPDALAEAQPPVREISILKLALDMPAEETPDTWGIVEIASTPPGASVVIGTEVVGKTPMVMVRPAGQTEIDLIHPDYPPQRRSLKVGHNEFLSFEHRLESNDTPSPSPRRTARRVARPPRREAKGGSDILENPHYIEALIHMTIGEYRKALALLDSLEERPETGHHDRKILADKRQECYRGLGDFRRALASHEQRYRTAPDTRAKAAALWQTATIRATCLGDYEGAERDLVNYIVSYPEGVWIEQAYLRLAEVQALQDDLRAAIETYRRHLKHFPHSAGRDKVLHALARLEGEGKRYSEAEKHYRLLLERHPQSRYAESALFYRAECLRTLNRDAEARTAYRAYLARYPQGHWRESCTRRLGRAHAMN
jgi:outer membrane protein assembly factor BamD (BamD/ComL family)